MNSPTKLSRRIWAGSLQLAISLAIAVGGVRGQTSNWPQWRGPSSGGISTEVGLPSEWSDTKNIRWKTAIPGRGHSSPIIWNNRIFLTSSIEGPVVPGAEAVRHIHKGQEYLHPDSVGADHSYTMKLFCLDVGTGRVLWEKTVYDLVFVSAGSQAKRALAIRLGGAGDLTDTPNIIWRYEKGTAYVPSPILYGDYL